VQGSGCLADELRYKHIKRIETSSDCKKSAIDYAMEVMAVPFKLLGQFKLKEIFTKLKRSNFFTLQSTIQYNSTCTQNSIENIAGFLTEKN
jgi:hypothetical protein